MLVLTRQTGEKILIGNDIVVTVTAIRGDRVQLGIDAPDSVKILRSELKPRAPVPSPLARYLSLPTPPASNAVA